MTPPRSLLGDDDYLEVAERSLLPDLPGKVHGIVSLDPPTVQCDGCGLTYSRPSLAMAVLTSDITFNARQYGTEKDRRRLCGPCRTVAGWPEH